MIPTDFISLILSGKKNKLRHEEEKRCQDMKKRGGRIIAFVRTVDRRFTDTAKMKEQLRCVASGAAQ